VISRSNPDGSWSAVHRTEVVKHSLNPVWRPFNIRVQALCNGLYDRNLKIDCYDWDDGTNDQLIGSFITSLKQLTAGSIYDCINQKKKLKKKDYKNSGICITVIFSKFFSTIVKSCFQYNFRNNKSRFNKYHNRNNVSGLH